ncbi:MAG: glycolate oxidase iron-sulfur subunit, partial [Solirubrobacteraceae bacterium]|nr:glycolate oxidase iron-sulfur subunit [Solirubrobacteraceae bacterium]
FPGVSKAVQKLLPGIAVPENQGCCGALHAHNGDSARGARMAERLGRRLPGAIITTAGGCAAHLAHHLGPDRVTEVSAYLVGQGYEAAGEVRVDGRRARVTLQDSCHLRNGLGVWKEPRELIARAGEYVELPSAAACCGAAGSYAVLRPDDSARVLDRHLDEIEAADLDVIVVVNPGCYRQLEQGLKRRRLRTRVQHIAELLAAPSRG